MCRTLDARETRVMIYTAKNHADAVQELTRRQIPFQEVTLVTQRQKQPALKLSAEALLSFLAGCFLSEN